MLTLSLGTALGSACLLADPSSCRAQLDRFDLGVRSPPAAIAGPFRLLAQPQVFEPEHVRGRLLPDGAEEDAYVVRSELIADGDIAPFGFVDSGSTRDFAGRLMTPVAAGVGVSWRLWPGAAAHLLTSYQVTSGPVTRPGDIKLGFALRLER